MVVSQLSVSWRAILRRWPGGRGRERVRRPAHDLPTPCPRWDDGRSDTRAWCPPVPVRFRPTAGGLVAGCGLALLITLLPVLPPPSVRGANELVSAAVSPTVGTTATDFEFTVVHRSDPQGHTPRSVTVEVAGLTLPMGLQAGGDPVTGLTYRAVSQLPGGSWVATFTAVVPSTDPDPVTAGPIDVAAVPSPTPSGSPPATFAPSLAPSPATPAPSASPSVTPTVSPRPLPTPPPTPSPPGQVPRPRPTAHSTPLPPVATPGPGAPVATAPPSAGQQSAEASPSGGDLPGRSSAARGSGSPPVPSTSPEGEPTGVRSGAGRLGWIALGGMTSVAGAVVLARQWKVRHQR